MPVISAVSILYIQCDGHDAAHCMDPYAADQTYIVSNNPVCKLQLMDNVSLSCSVDNTGGPILIYCPYIWT